MGIERYFASLYVKIERDRVISFLYTYEITRKAQKE